MILYHGCTAETVQPAYGYGRADKDCGPGFYMTKSADLGREWAVQDNTDGVLYKYNLDTNGLNVLNLTDGKHGVLHWIALLVSYRTVDIVSEVMEENIACLKRKFLPDTGPYDCIAGPCGDSIYFSYVQEFLGNGLTYEALNGILRRGDRNMQYVLKSPKAFDKISFLGAEPVCSSTWYPKKTAREAKTAAALRRMLQQAKKPSEGLLMTDIVRQEMEANDSRLHL